jgi:hypothetical protein
MMTSGVILWWMLLCAVGAGNIVLWSLSARWLNGRRDLLTAREYTVRKQLLFLSALYVLGCAYRSVFPVFDVPRIVLVDSFWSSVAVGRTVATVAELAFVAQWALLLRESARTTGSIIGKITAQALVPLIVIAECCSWYSVLSTSNLGHTAEESIWALAAAALAASLFVIWQRSHPKQRPVLAAGCFAATTYVVYMVFVDVPMYAERWMLAGQSGGHYLSIAEGLKDVATRWTVSYRWQDWRTEVVWMALYFSVCVWISLSLVRVPSSVSRMTLAAKARANFPRSSGELQPQELRNRI